MKKMASFIFVLMFLTGISSFAGDSGQMGIPDNAEDICPMKIGAEVPDVEVTGLDGETFRLREIAAEKPTIFIFYRGSW